MLIGPNEPPPTTFEDLLGPELVKRLSRLDVASRRVFAGRLPGERRSKRRGQSVEFDDYRTYVPGDDLRHIDWNVFARMDKFFLKLFREEEDVTVEIVLDLSPSMDTGGTRTTDAQGTTRSLPSKRTFASRLATALAYIGLIANNRVRLTTFGRGFHQTAAARGRSQVARFTDFMIDRLRDVAQDHPVTPFADDMRRLVQSRTGSGVVVVLSDMLLPDGYAPGLTYLAASRGFEVTVLQVLAPSELDPALEPTAISGDLRLTDIESGRYAEVSITPELIDAYRTSVDAYNAELARTATARGIAHVLLTTDTPIELALLRRLRERGLVR